MDQLRVSAISFLNTIPLMWDFMHTQETGRFKVSYTLPSLCAADLQAGKADIGLIPVAAYGSIPGLRVIPEVAIAAKNAVRSILLISKVPLGAVNTIAADNASRTSVALARVLLKKQFGRTAVVTAMPASLDAMIAICDAALLIGDHALKAKVEGYLVYDLAQEWRSFTGKPFVFAFWAAREQAVCGTVAAAATEVSKVFRQSRDHGFEHLDEIAQQWSAQVGISQAEAATYLRDNIHYFLDQENIAGMKLFFEYAEQCGVLPHTPELVFL